MAATSSSLPKADLLTLDAPQVTPHLLCRVLSPIKFLLRYCSSRPRMRFSERGTSSSVSLGRRALVSTFYPRFWMSKLLSYIWITSTPSCQSCPKRSPNTSVFQWKDPIRMTCKWPSYSQSKRFRCTSLTTLQLPILDGGSGS